MGVVGADDVEVERSPVSDRREMVGGVDLVAPHRFGGVVARRKSDRNQVDRAKQQTATLFRSRRLGMPLDRIDRLGGDVQLAAGTSITMAMPMPPPMQSDATPFPPPRLRNS